ncbi:MAG: TSCPD domain-containing protein, partial [Ghiorsea sp.]|nr:TSCPD domain-containing protein [Ghiorsea sp.]
MSIKIEKKITGYAVVKPEDEAEKQESKVASIAPLLERDEILVGQTYKIKTPHSEHAMYITINDVIVNQGEESEHRRPFEVFINTKNMEHFMWIVTLTRIISAIFRKGGDITFLVEELKAVFDPRGGYYKKGGKYMPSIVAEIGEVIQKHLVSIGMMEGQLQTEELVAKRIEAEEKLGTEGVANASNAINAAQWQWFALDNCNCCLECG